VLSAFTECHGSNLEQADAAIGPPYDETLLCKFDILLCR
jgi:hypothetical protein